MLLHPLIHPKSNVNDYDQSFNESAGICELDKSLKRLLEKLHIAIDQIANDEEVCISF